MKKLMFVIFLLLPFELLLARPRYANRQQMDCRLCHINPQGGGPRTLTGKAFGSHGLGFAKLSSQEKIYGDFRALYYLPEDTRQSPSGLALMKASVSYYENIIDMKDKGKVSFLVNYDFSPMAFSNTRELYFQWQTGEMDSWKPSHIVFGRFYEPFGLQLEEHRSYVRIQNKSSMREFDFGAMVSGNPSSLLHYDLSITSGLNGSGGNLSTGGATAQATTLNLRYNPENYMIGISGQYEEVPERQDPAPWATSIYSVIALDQYIEFLPKIDLSLEASLAENWNDRSNLSSYFTSGNPAFSEGVKEKTSMAYLARLDYDINNKWVITYKYDQIVLNRNFEGDRFMRHGIGFLRRYGPNTTLMLRAEKAVLGREDLNEEALRGAKDVVIGQLRIWF